MGDDSDGESEVSDGIANPLDPTRLCFDAINDLYDHQTEFGKVVIRSALTSNENSMLRQRVMEALTTQIERSAFKQSSRKIVIHESLTTEQSNVLDRAYSKFDISFAGGNNNQHAFAAASRTLEFYTLLAKIGYEQDRDYKPMLDRLGYEAYFCDIGANYPIYLRNNMKHVHCCSPILDLTDSIRSANRKTTLLSSILNESLVPSKELSETIEVVNKFKGTTRTICCSKSQDCKITAPFAISLHSSYDMTARQIADTMEKKNILSLVGTFLYSDEMFLKKEGKIKDIGATWTYSPDGKKILFTFENDMSTPYVHLTKNYFKFIVCRVFRSSTGALYVVELLENVLGVQYFRVVKSEKALGDAFLYQRIPFPSITHKYRVEFEIQSYDNVASRYPTFLSAVFNLEHSSTTEVLDHRVLKGQIQTAVLGQRADIEVETTKSGVTSVGFYIEKEIIDAGMSWAFGVTEAKFKPLEIYNYLRSHTSKMYVGKEVIQRYSDISPVLLLHAAFAIYIYVYDKKFNEGLALQSYIKGLSHDRELANKGLFGKYFSSRSGRKYIATGLIGRIELYLYNKRKSHVDVNRLIMHPLEYVQRKLYFKDKVKRDTVVTLEMPDFKNKFHGVDLNEIVKDIVCTALGVEKDVPENIPNNVVDFISDGRTYCKNGIILREGKRTEIVETTVCDSVADYRKLFCKLSSIVPKHGSLYMPFNPCLIIGRFFDEPITREFSVNKTSVTLYGEEREYYVYRRDGGPMDFSKVVYYPSNEETPAMLLEEITGDTDVQHVNGYLGEAKLNRFGNLINVIPISDSLTKLKEALFDGQDTTLVEKLYQKHENNYAVTDSMPNRSAVKLKEIDEAFEFSFLNGNRILDLCAFPGGFARYSTSKLRKVSYDYVSKTTTTNKIKKLYIPSSAKNLGGPAYDLTSPDYFVFQDRHYDIVLADGSVDTDYNDVELDNQNLLLHEAVVALRTLKIGGKFLVKFMGLRNTTTRSILKALCCSFRENYLIKPKSSKKTNSEFYFVGLGLKQINCLKVLTCFMDLEIDGKLGPAVMWYPEGDNRLDEMTVNYYNRIVGVQRHHLQNIQLEMSREKWYSKYDVVWSAYELSQGENCVLLQIVKKFFSMVAERVGKLIKISEIYIPAGEKTFDDLITAVFSYLTRTNKITACDMLSLMVYCKNLVIFAAKEAKFCSESDEDEGISSAGSLSEDECCFDEKNFFEQEHEESCFDDSVLKQMKQALSIEDDRVLKDCVVDGVTLSEDDDLQLTDDGVAIVEPVVDLYSSFSSLENEENYGESNYVTIDPRELMTDPKSKKIVKQYMCISSSEDEVCVETCSNDIEDGEKVSSEPGTSVSVPESSDFVDATETERVDSIRRSVPNISDTTTKVVSNFPPFRSVVMKTPGDGRCLFWALFHNNDPSPLLKFLYNSLPADAPDDLVEEITSGYGGYDSIKYFSSVFQITVVVHDVNNDQYIQFGDHEEYIYLSYKNDHYNREVRFCNKCMCDPVFLSYQELNRVRVFGYQREDIITYVRGYDVHRRFLLHRLSKDCYMCSFDYKKYTFTPLIEIPLKGVKLVDFGLVPGVFVKKVESNKLELIDCLKYVSKHRAAGCSACVMGGTPKYCSVDMALKSCCKNLVGVTKKVTTDKVKSYDYEIIVEMKGSRLVVEQENNIIHINYISMNDKQEKLCEYLLRKKFQQMNVPDSSTIRVTSKSNVDLNFLTSVLQSHHVVHNRLLAETVVKPISKLETSDLEVMYNSAEEMKYVWYTTFTTVGEKLRLDYELAITSLSGNRVAHNIIKDTSFGLIDVQSGVVCITPRTDFSGTAFVYYYENDSKEHRFVKVEKVFGKTIDFKRLKELLPNVNYVCFSKLTKVMNEQDLYMAAANLSVDATTANFKVTIVEGVPGAGKTQYILDNHKTKGLLDVVVTATREAAADLKKRTNCDNRKKYRTIDSLMIHLNEYKHVQVEKLWVDEGLMKHFGLIVLAAVGLNVEELVICGDTAQIPYFNNEGIKTTKHSYKDRLKTANVIYLKETHRMPLDACAYLSSMKTEEGRPVYDFDIKTYNQVETSISLEIAKNVTTVKLPPKVQILTFTQMDKFNVQSTNGGNHEVNTVGEFQGKQAEHVVLLRVQDKEIATYSNINQFVVALSRHTKSFKYITPVKDDLAKLLTRVFDRNSLRKHKVSNKGGGHVYNSSRENDDRFFPRLTPNEQYLDYSVRLRPAYCKNLNNESKVLNNLVMNHGYTGYVQVKPMFDCLLEMPEYVPKPVLIHTDCESNTIQDFVDRIYPGSSGDYRYENEIFESDDLYITATDFSFSNCLPPPIIRDYLTPVIRTSCPVVMAHSQKQVIKAFNERNGGVPDMAGRIPEVMYANKMIKTFKRVFIADNALLKEYKNNPMQINVDTITDWLQTQPSEVLKVLEQEMDFSIYDKTLTNYFYMLKRNSKPVLDPNPQNKNASPQAIAYQEKLINGVFCPMVKDLKQRLISVMRKDKVICCDMSPDSFENLLNYRFPVENLESFKYRAEIDFSKYDKSQGLLALQFETQIMLELGVPVELVFLWVLMHKITTLTSLELKFKALVEYQRKSGDAMTFLGNTMFLMAVIATAVDIVDGDSRKANFRKVFGVFAGDDSYLWMTEDFDRETFLKICTVVFNMEVKLLNYNFPYFCSKFIVPFDGKWYVVPDLAKMCVKLGRKDLVSTEHVEQYRVSTLDNIKVYNDAMAVEMFGMAVADRYKLNYNPYLVFLCVYNLCADESKFKNLFILHDNDVLYKTSKLPSLDL